MKKLVPLTILMAGALSGFSQGVVSFQNSTVFVTPAIPSDSGRLVYNVGSILSTNGGVKLSGTNFVAELFVGAAGMTSFDSLTPIQSSISRFRLSSSANIGKWNTTTVTGGFNSGIDLGVPIGTVVTLGVAVWDLRDTPTYSRNGIHGESQLFSFTAADPGGAASGFVMEGFQSFALVPEPSAIALGLMGVAGLLLIRRRK